ncbi:hypothetical protein [Novosphingobium humi]|uniref:Uncharacterized protein n=1 Tax=Novosphingobium humi TaxID=2282397 RepID=A0ABY7TZA9_9SPHN|nr:hypothetical protein [Novosphingobium humi]WCT78605.1 hypothetical protein PQ457_06495 [Novosphingobium humi]
MTSQHRKGQTMTDPASELPPARKWFSIALVILVLVVLFLWYSPHSGKPKQEQPVAPTPRSTEWAPEPTGPAVPVNLPRTPMTNVPDRK